AIELEAHDHSPEIAFARLVAETVRINFQTKARIEVRQLQMDFSDFTELHGEYEAKAAFDLGFAVLHELVHGVLGLQDAADGTAELGACDEQINRIRRELNLPERQVYSALTRSVSLGPAGTVRQSELVFARERTKPGRARIEKFYLRWNADRVA